MSEPAQVPSSYCDTCEEYHCDLCGRPMEMTDHELAMCSRRRIEDGATYFINIHYSERAGAEEDLQHLVKHMIARGYLGDVVSELALRGHIAEGVSNAEFEDALVEFSAEDITTPAP